MKELLKNGALLFLKTIVVNIMCFFVVISFSVLTTALFTENIGYKAYGTTSDSSDASELYTYYFDDGEDTKKAEFEKNGYKVTTSSIRSQVTKTGNTVFLTVSQIFCIMILAAFVYPKIWDIGTKDSNLVKFKHKAEDKYKGFKIGAIAVIPSYLLLLLMLLTPFMPPVLYKFLNAYMYSVIDIIVSGALKAADLAIWRRILFFVLPLVIPIISGVAYLLGYNNISLGEKFIYKKK